MIARLYHTTLRVSSTVVAIVLLFDGGFVVPLTKQLSDNTIQYLASSSGVFAAVPPNELNSITAELTARERELDAREREIATREFGDGEPTDYSTYILSTILFILTTLIILNYALDWARERRIRYEKQAA